MEPRLVLSHAPFTDFSPALTPDVAGPSTALYGAALSGNSWSGLGSFESAGQNPNGSSQSPNLLSDGPGNTQTHFAGGQSASNYASSFTPGQGASPETAEDVDWQPITLEVALVPTPVQVVQTFGGTASNGGGLTLVIVSEEQTGVELGGFGETIDQAAAQDSQPAEDNQPSPPSDSASGNGWAHAAGTPSTSTYNSASNYGSARLGHGSDLCAAGV